MTFDEQDSLIESLNAAYDKAGTITDEDIKELGEISARHFDEIIIRCDKNLRGRTADEIIGLLKEGMDSVNPDIPTTIIPNEDLALDHIYENPKEGALYTIMCDVVARALDKIKELKQREELELKNAGQTV